MQDRVPGRDAAASSLVLSVPFPNSGAFMSGLSKNNNTLYVGWHRNQL